MSASTWKTFCSLFVLVAVCHADCYRRRTECIEYEVLHKNENFEERAYPRTTWATTSLKGPSLARSMREMYRMLFRYIQGENSQGQFINSTFPVRTHVLPCHGCNGTYTMSFLIPAGLGLFPPAPTNPRIAIITEEPRHYLVRSFDGLATENIWLQEGTRLLQLLKREVGIDRSGFYLTWYDPPLRLFNRLNEVWVERKPKKALKTRPKSSKYPK